MTTDVALFWAVVAIFLIFDNLVLLPSAGDTMYFDSRGKLRYPSGTRLIVRGRELVILNPVNLFQRIAITSASIGTVLRKDYRQLRRQISNAAPTLNFFAWLGYVYFTCILVLAFASTSIGFGIILLILIAFHFLFWLTVTLLLVARRQLLDLTAYSVFVLSLESLLVPAYCLNMSKRVWYRRTYNVPAMTLGLRDYGRTQLEADRELIAHELGNRLTVLAQDFSDDVEVMRYVLEARKCLKA